MTYEEALAYFNRRKETYGLSDSVQQAENKAIEAIEKQIPQKPDHNEYSSGNRYFCPNCKDIIDLTDHHCSCGQAIDFSEVS